MLGKIGKMRGAFEVKFENEVSELNTRQLEIVALRASGLSNAEIAVKIGASVKTVEKNFAQPAVKAAIREARNQIRDQTISLLASVEAAKLVALTVKDDWGGEELEDRLRQLESLLAARAELRGH